MSALATQERKIMIVSSLNSSREVIVFNSASGAELLATPQISALSNMNIQIRTEDKQMIVLTADTILPSGDLLLIASPLKQAGAQVYTA